MAKSKPTQIEKYRREIASFTGMIERWAALCGKVPPSLEHDRVGHIKKSFRKWMSEWAEMRYRFRQNGQDFTVTPAMAEAYRLTKILEDIAADGNEKAIAALGGAK